MTIIRFDTSDPFEARRRLDRVGDTNAAQRDYLTVCVREGLIRVGDPAMYGGTAPINVTDACSPEQGNAIVERFHELAGGSDAG